MKANKFVAKLGNDTIIKVYFYDTDGGRVVAGMGDQPQSVAPFDLSGAKDVRVDLVDVMRGKRTKMSPVIDKHIMSIELNEDAQRLGEYFLDIRFGMPNGAFSDGVQAYRLKLSGISIVESGETSGDIGATFEGLMVGGMSRAELLAEVEQLKQDKTVIETELSEMTEAKAQAESERDEANRGKATAETERDQALEGKAQAESERDQALESKATAETERDQALEGKAQAESERDQALESKATAETERDEANKAKTTAETERDQALQDKATAETERDEANRAKATAETERDEARQDKATAEGERNQALEGKATAETERDEANRAKATAETERDEANRAKATAEGERDQARQDKAAADEAKAQAEQERDQANEAKAKAETQRDQAWARVDELEANANNGVGGDDSNAGKTTLEVEDEEFSDADRMSHLLRLANDSRGSFNAGDIHLKQVAVINGDGKEMQYPMATHNDWLSCASSIRADRLAHLYGSSLTLKGEINMPKLRSIKTNNGLNLSSVTSINMPSLEAIYGDVRGVNVETIDLPSLKSCGTLDVNSSVIKIPNIVACKVKAPNATYIDLSNVSRRNINSADISLDLSATTSPGVLTIKVSPYVYNWIFTDVEGDVYPSLYIFKALGMPPIKSGNTREEDEYQLNVTDGNNTKTYRHIGSLDDDFFIPLFEGDM